MEAWRILRENSGSLKTKVQGAHQGTVSRIWSGQASEASPTGGEIWGTLLGTLGLSACEGAGGSKASVVAWVDLVGLDFMGCWTRPVA